MFKWIPYSNLAKADYNRAINRKHLNEIKNNWCEDLKQPVIVSFRDGKNWIIDHQHQATAEYELNGKDPNTLIYCDVRTGLTYEEEARLYYMLNTTSMSLGFADELNGLIEAKDSSALEFRYIVERNGYLVGSGASNSLGAVRTAYRVFEKPNGGKKLDELLGLTNSCWPGIKAGVSAEIICGISKFITEHGKEYDRNQFVKALAPQDPKDIKRKARSFYKQMDSRSFTQPYCTYMILVKSYNAGLRSKKLTPATPEN